jgi:hypothetical protein
MQTKRRLNLVQKVLVKSVQILFPAVMKMMRRRQPMLIQTKLKPKNNVPKEKKERNKKEKDF